MRIAITGAKGMLGRTLLRSFPEHVLIPTDLPELDITEKESVVEFFGENEPDVVIHCAAMTAVDDCEQKKEQAFRINAEGTKNVSQACASNGSSIVLISTDYVFAGDLDRPYIESDRPCPQTVYGKSKLRAENMVESYCPKFTIARISWLYGAGGPSFLHTIMRLAQKRDTIKVVNDQIGNPTSADAVANGLRYILERPLHGIVHLTCEGEASWYDFAKKILQSTHTDCRIEPCSTAEFARLALRPANSRLDNKALRDNGYPSMPHWKEALKQFCRNTTLS